MSPAELPEDLLSAYLDDELDPTTRAAVEARLAESPEWRRVLLEVGAARDAVRGLPPVEPSADAWRQLLVRVAAEEPSAEGAPGRVAALRRQLARPPVRFAGALVGAAAVAVVVAALVLPSPSRVTPKVATFNTEQQARASVSSDPVSSLAGLSVMPVGLGR